MQLASLTFSSRRWTATYNFYDDVEIHSHTTVILDYYSGWKSKTGTAATLVRAEGSVKEHGGHAILQLPSQRKKGT